MFASSRWKAKTFSSGNAGEHPGTRGNAFLRFAKFFRPELLCRRNNLRPAPPPRKNNPVELGVNLWIDLPILEKCTFTRPGIARRVFCFPRITERKNP
jgi:hypothetical protein